MKLIFMPKKLVLAFLLFLMGFTSSAQYLSARLGLLPNDWLSRQGVPAFIELGVEYAPMRRLAVAASYKLFDNSFERNSAFGRPGFEVSAQPRYYFGLEEFNDGAFVAFPVSYGLHGKYTAVNALDGCEDTFYQHYWEYSAFIGYKTTGRWGFEFFGGPSRRITDFFQEPTCGDSAGQTLTVSSHRKWLLEVGARLTYRIL